MYYLQHVLHLIRTELLKLKYFNYKILKYPQIYNWWNNTFVCKTEGSSWVLSTLPALNPKEWRNTFCSPLKTWWLLWSINHLNRAWIPEPQPGEIGAAWHWRNKCCSFRKSIEYHHLRCLCALTCDFFVIWKRKKIYFICAAFIEPQILPCY